MDANSFTIVSVRWTLLAFTHPFFLSLLDVAFIHLLSHTSVFTGLSRPSLPLSPSNLLPNLCSNLHLLPSRSPQTSLEQPHWSPFLLVHSNNYKHGVLRTILLQRITFGLIVIPMMLVCNSFCHSRFYLFYSDYDGFNNWVRVFNFLICNLFVVRK